MNFINRAWLNVKAKKGRTILQILVLAAILMFVLAGIIIKQGATTAANNAKKAAGATVTLSANRQTAFANMEKSSSKNAKLNLASVSVATAKKIAKSSYVKSYTIATSTSANASSFTAITTTGASGAAGGNGPGGKTGSATSTGSLTISGVSATASASAFTNGTAKIVSGRGITTADEGTNNVVIEKQLAKKNSLKVGATITIKSTSGTKYKLKVVGIYKSSSSSQSMMNDPSNTLYTSYTFANTLKGSKYKNTADSVVFNLADPSKSSQFIKYAKTLISTSKFSLTTDKSTYETILTPLNNVKSIASKIVWLVAIAGTIILALIIILMIRERRYEIGVLLSLGEKRTKVIAQLFTELLMVMVVAMVIAGIGGKFVGNAMGKQSQSTSTTQTTSQTAAPGGGASNQQGGPGGGGRMMNATSSSASTTASINASVSLVSLIELGGFGLAIIFLSIMLGSINILRLQPKKILID